MLRDDVLLRMIERLAEAVGAFLAGDGSRSEVQRELQATTGLTLAVIDVLPAEAIVPPVDDRRVWQAKARAIAEALEALGRTDKAAQVRALADR